MKTLVISYLPRGERSKTKILLQSFLDEAKAKNIEIEHLDLLQTQPDFFDQDKILAYSLRNYMGQALPPEQASLLINMDRMTQQFKSADSVVVAFPMYNFSMPGIVKTYFDGIMQKGETWDINDKGYVGLMTGKKALILMTSGGDYSSPQMQAWEHGVSLARTCFQFMGFGKIDDVAVGGVNANPDSVNDKLIDAHNKISGIVSEWIKK